MRNTLKNLGVQILENFQLIVPHESSVNKVLDLRVELKVEENYYFLKSKSKPNKKITCRSGNLFFTRKLTVLMHMQ